MKAIAWINHVSVAVAESPQAAFANAAMIVGTPRWQRFQPGQAVVRVTTYGAQRLIFEATVNAAGQRVTESKVR